jgi:hypothetical protein
LIWNKNIDSRQPSMSGQEVIAAREGQTALQDITDPKQIDEALRRLVEGEGHALIDGVDLTWQSNDTSAIPTHAKVAIVNSFGDEADFPVSNRRCAHAAQARFFRGILESKRPRAPRDHRHPIRTIVLVATEMHYDAQAHCNGPKVLGGLFRHIGHDLRSGRALLANNTDFVSPASM